MFENMEQELAKLILENNNNNGINSNSPNSINISGNTSCNRTKINSTGICLNVPSIVVSCDNNNNNNNNNNFGNIKNCNSNNGLFNKTRSPSPPPTLTINNKDNNNNNNNNNNGQQQQQYTKESLATQMKQKKKQSLERRDPSNVLIMENINESKAQLVQSLVEDKDLNFSFSVQLVRYLNHFKSLILVFSHKNEAELCKLLVTRQDSIKLDKETIVYFGKELPIQTISKYQLCTPFPNRQYLISPPLSPPNEWAPPGDGLEQPPSDIDPFATVTTVSVGEICDINDTIGSNNTTGSINNCYDDDDDDDNNKNNNNNNNNNNITDCESPSSSIMGFSTYSNSNNSADQFSDRLRRVIYQDNTSNNFPSITLEFVQ